MSLFARKTLAERAAAHRALAIAALSANSSASVRLKRYRQHMQVARTLEVSHGAR
jgi:hypothetical protein